MQRFADMVSLHIICQADISRVSVADRKSFSNGARKTWPRRPQQSGGRMPVFRSQLSRDIIVGICLRQAQYLVSRQRLMDSQHPRKADVYKTGAREQILKRIDRVRPDVCFGPTQSQSLTAARGTNAGASRLLKPVNHLEARPRFGIPQVCQRSAMCLSAINIRYRKNGTSKASG